MFSRAAWGGAPDQTIFGWPYHGPRAFHGHEAPSYGRFGSWPPRREAPLGQGGLIIGDTSKRGMYGKRVGLELPGTSYANVDQLNTQIVGFARAIVTSAGGNALLIPSSSASSDIKAMHDALASYPNGGFGGAVVDSHDAIKKSGAIGAFWYDEVSPFLTEWQAFEQKHTHWYDLTTQLATGSAVYRTFATRLNALRVKAKSLGIKLPADQTPTSESESLFGDLERLLGSAGKVIIISALAIGGAFAIAEVAKRSKS